MDDDRPWPEDVDPASVGPAAHPNRPTDHYVVAPGPDGVREGRRYVRHRVLEAGLVELVDDASLIAAELLANAHQHGAPPVSIEIDVGPGRVRLEVSDSSPRWPLVAPLNNANMTGRGFALVDAVSASWGVRREANGGKTIWCELVSQAGADARVTAAVDLEALLAGDVEPSSLEPQHTVVLGDVPTGMLIEAKAHVDNLVRELSLAAAGSLDAGAPDLAAPNHLAALIESVVHGFADARESIKRQALAAAQRGEPRTSLTLYLPASAAAAGERYLAALDEVDGYARAARLLTLEAPPDHRLFRRWYVEAVATQLRRLERGEPVLDIEPFESRLLAEVRAMAAAQRVSDQASRLQRVTAAFARARTPEDVASVVISEAVAALGAYGGGLLVPASDGEHLAVPGAVGYAEDLMGQLREERIDAELPAATAMRTGSAIWIESPDERNARFPEMSGFEPHTIAMCAVPLMVGERSIGAMRFSFDTAKLFDQSERHFVEALATQTAQTLQRTELYEAERQATIGLQQALLPQEVAGIRGWEIAAYYSPAGGQQVGGDFYDVFPVTGGRIAAVVGDVMGRGVQAAASMAEIRSAIRAYAVDNPDPNVVLRRVDSYFEAFGLEQLVTVLYLLVDRGSDVVQIASAGHLPPLLVSRRGAQTLDVTGGLPFGVGIDDRTIHTFRLEPGEAVVAITDGLIERRGEDIDQGLARLLESLGHASWTTARALVNRVVAASSDENEHDDDVTVLVLRRGEH